LIDDSHPLARISSRVVLFASLIRQAGRRLRYRRAELQRLSAVEMLSQGAPAGDDVRWVSAVTLGGVAHDALICGPDAQVTYDVTLPPNAAITTWCGMRVDDGLAAPADLEFIVEVRTQDSVSSRRCTVSGQARTLGHRWHRLTVVADRPGPARIVLRVAPPADASGGSGVRALWGDPAIETARTPEDFRSAFRSAANRGQLWHRALPPNEARLYQLWVREHEPTSEMLRAQRQWASAQTRSFSLVTWTAGDATRLQRTAASLLGQSYPRWEWILVAAEGLPVAQKAAARFGGAVKIVSVADGVPRADAWNAACAEAGGEFVALLDEGDTLSPSALHDAARLLEHSPDCDILYSDEDRLRAGGSHRHDPRFKPDWSPDLLLARNYIGRLAMLRLAAMKAVDGFRADAAPTEEWDLYRRLAQRHAVIRRLPACAYHRDETRPEPSHDDRRVVWETAVEPTVSVIIPNKEAAPVLRQCLSGLLAHTAYRNLEVIVVDNDSTDPATLDLYRSLHADSRVRVVPFAGPFNYSAACNLGALNARGDLLLFLNNDIEVVDADWLDELVGWAQQPEIGIVGAKLLYPDGRIQHAGVAFGLGLVGHIFARAPEGISGVFGSPESYRNYLAVTGACQMMRKTVFDELGGYDERFRLTFSDVVLCMEAWRAGYRVVYTPYARLVHHESYTRQRNESPPDMVLLAQYLQTSGFEEDPFFHPELDPKSATPAVRPPFDPPARIVIRNYVERVLAAAR